jgi:hypothetical protein
VRVLDREWQLGIGDLDREWQLGIGDLDGRLGIGDLDREWQLGIGDLDGRLGIGDLDGRHRIGLGYLDRCHHPRHGDLDGQEQLSIGDLDSWEWVERWQRRVGGFGNDIDLDARDRRFVHKRPGASAHRPADGLA